MKRMVFKMNSFISWTGGKKLLRNKIVNLFPKEFERYVEVFGGAGWVFFNSDRHAPQEIFNDYNNDLINLYRCVKYHCPELQREMEYLFVSRKQFFDAKSQLNSEGLTDIQRAARYFLLIKVSFGSNKKSFGTNKRNLADSVEYLSKISERLKNVVIENRDFESVIKTYDRENALLYLDPPYYETEKYYDGLFKKDDHLRLAALLSNIKGKFILSYNDCEFIRELYKDYEVLQISRNHNLKSKTNSCKYDELIIKNY